MQWQDPLLKHLALTHALYQRWQSKQVDSWTPDRLKKERALALKYVTDNKDSAFGWIMLTLLQDRADKDRAASDKFDKSFYLTLAEHWELFQKSGLSYAARYEEARCLYHAGKTVDARKHFVALYNDTLKDGYLPLLDSTARSALLTGPAEAGWGELMQGTAEKLIADKNRPAVLALAWQCWQLDDAPQADQLLQMALTGIDDAKERNTMQLAGVLFYQQTKQLPQADQLLTKLLVDPKQAEKPGLWRLASELASQRKMTARSMECLEKALDLEFKKLPAFINVKQVREDYGELLGHYQKMADAVVALKLPPPEGFVAKVVKTADRWRALDPKTGSACNTAADILIALSQKDLGWDYLTTPVAMQPNESGPWSTLAETLRQGGEPSLADLAYRAAYDAEPTNPQLLWDRAENLQQSGKTVQAQTLYRQIAEGHWAPHHAGLVAQAKQRLK